MIFHTIMNYLKMTVAGVGILVVFIGLIAGFWFYSGKDQSAEIVD